MLPRGVDAPPHLQELLMMIAPTLRRIALAALLIACCFALGACTSDEVGDGDEINQTPGGTNQTPGGGDNQTPGGGDNQTPGGEADAGEIDAGGGTIIEDDPDVSIPEIPDPDVGPAPDVGNGGQNAEPGDPCDGNGDCAASLVCARDLPGESGTCEIPTDERLDGDACDDPTQCTTGLCAEGFCTRECDDCLAGWPCEDQICHPPGCATEADCGPGQNCSFWTGDGGIDTVCLPSNAGGAPGAPCQQHSECRTRYCHDGRCTAPCLDSGDCSSAQICTDADIAIDGYQENFEICTEFELTECSSPGDCGAEDLTCNRLPASIMAPACGLRNPGQAGLGEDCSQPSDCDSDLCWPAEDPGHGECSVYCDANSDCSPDQTCTYRGTDFARCMRSCANDGDCLHGNVCQVSQSVSDQTHGYCGPPLGDKGIGEECSGGSECANALCMTMSNTQITNESCDFDAHCETGFVCECPPNNTNCTDKTCISTVNEQRCSSICDPSNGDADCAGGHVMDECRSNITITWPSGMTGNLSACLMSF